MFLFQLLLLNSTLHLHVKILRRSFPTLMIFTHILVSGVEQPSPFLTDILNPRGKGRSKAFTTLGRLFPFFPSNDIYTDVLSVTDNKRIEFQRSRKTTHHYSRCVPREAMKKTKIPTSCCIKGQK